MDSLHFIQGGRNGVVLNGPMGSRIRGDTLWVIDIDALRAFDTRSGNPLTTVDLTPVHPLFTNDISFGPNGDIYITDTGTRMKPDGPSEHPGPDRIYRVTRDGRVTVALQSAALDEPDGIAWNSQGQDFLLAPIGGEAIQTWKPGQRAPVNLPPGAGKFDGIEVERDGRAFITSWADSSVLQLRGTRLSRTIGPLDAPPADISLDQRNGRIAVVFLTANRFELWDLGAGS
jgi:sugar lactone lactonase YvrE